MKNIKSRLAPAFFAAVAVILELLPYGAVLNFANPEGESLRRTYSYFDPITYGYANFAPFLTAILSCILLGLSAVYLLRGADKLRRALRAVSLATLILSVLPAFYGLYSAVGGFISAALALCLASSLKKPS